MKRLLGILNRLSLFRTRRANGEVDAAVEYVVDSIDRKLRLVPAYRKKLYGPVSRSLDYISTLVDDVPGPIYVSRSTYVSNPDVRAYFASADVMVEVFRNSTELRSYFSKFTHRHAGQCFALLCANKEEKRVIGSELVGSVVRHDIMQTAVNFHDYKILSPASSDYKVRKGIKRCIFDGLITYALQHVAGIKLKRKELLNRQRILHAQLRARQVRAGGLSAMLAQAQPEAATQNNLEEQFIRVRNKLDKTLGKRDVLAFYLDEVNTILSVPEDFIRLNRACFRLSDMRIKVADNADQAANTVCFSELEIADVMQRVVAVVNCSREEMV